MCIAIVFCVCVVDTVILCPIPSVQMKCTSKITHHIAKQQTPTNNFLTKKITVQPSTNVNNTDFVSKPDTANQGRFSLAAIVDNFFRAERKTHIS